MDFYVQSTAQGYLTEVESPVHSNSTPGRSANTAKNLSHSSTHNTTANTTKPKQSIISTPQSYCNHIQLRKILPDSLRYIRYKTESIDQITQLRLIHCYDAQEHILFWCLFVSRKLSTREGWAGIDHLVEPKIINTNLCICNLW